MIVVFKLGDSNLDLPRILGVCGPGLDFFYPCFRHPPTYHSHGDFLKYVRVG